MMPNMTEKMPPMMGSGMVTKSAPTLVQAVQYSKVQYILYTVQVQVQVQESAQG